jgi:hypothetical protein
MQRYDQQRLASAPRQHTEYGISLVAAKGHKGQTWGHHHHEVCPQVDRSSLARDLEKGNIQNVLIDGYLWKHKRRLFFFFFLR